MRGRSRARVAALALGALLATLAGGKALAYFTATGSGASPAGVSSLAKPLITAATPAVGGIVTLTWAAVPAPGAGSVTYFVTRDDGTPAGTCPTESAPAAVTTCIDKEVDPGTHSYVVTANWSSWSAAGNPATANVTVGAATHFGLTVTSTTPVAGATNNNITITALDVNDSKVTTYSGSKTLTFSGASAAPAGNAPTVTNASNSAIAFGNATAITFSSGAATRTMRIYRAGPAAISATDGSLATEAPLAVTVGAAALSKLVLAVETTTPAVGAADNLTLSAQDTYGNPIPTYTGAKTLTFTGPVASPNGTAPTVTDSAGEAIAFGTLTTIEFDAGVATVADGANGEMRLYKSAAAAVKFTDGSLTSASLTVTPPAGSAVRLALASSTATPVAGASVTLTVTAQDTYGNAATTYTGSKTLTFSGASAAPAGNAPTVTNASGSAIAFGNATAVTFSSGVGSRTMRIYRAAAASVAATDGSLSTEAPLAVTVSTAALSKLVLTAETTTPAVGAADNLTLSAQDTYGNPIPTYTGAKALTFTGPVASPNGTVPTVTDSAGEAIAFGTPTTIEFDTGVATVAHGANGEMRLYKSASAGVKFTDGSLTSASVTMVPPSGPAAKFTLAASTLTPAVNANVNLTTTAQDPYGNTATSYAGSKAIFFSGAGTSPGGNAPTVVNAAGVAVALGGETVLTFTNGVAAVGSSKNGLFKTFKAEVATLAATDGTISSATAPTLMVSPTTPSKLALTNLAASAGSLGSPCYFTCTATGIGNSATIKAVVVVTDTYGNVVSNVGTGHSVAVTTTGGSVSGGAITFPATGPAESPSEFIYTAPASGAFTNTIKAATSAGTSYANATVTASR